MSSSFEDDHHETVMKNRVERVQRQVNAIRDRVDRMHESMNARKVGPIQESEVNQRFEGKMVSEVLRDMVSRYFEQDGNEIDKQ